MRDRMTYAKLRCVIVTREIAAILAVAFAVLWFIGFVAVGTTYIFSTVPTWLAVTDGMLFLAIFVAVSISVNADHLCLSAARDAVYEEFAWDPRTANK